MYETGIPLGFKNYFYLFIALGFFYYCKAILKHEKYNLMNKLKIDSTGVLQ